MPNHSQQRISSSPPRWEPPEGRWLDGHQPPAGGGRWRPERTDRGRRRYSRSPPRREAQEGRWPSGHPSQAGEGHSHRSAKGVAAPSDRTASRADHYGWECREAFPATRSAARPPGANRAEHEAAERTRISALRQRLRRHPDPRLRAKPCAHCLQPHAGVFAPVEAEVCRGPAAMQLG